MFEEKIRETVIIELQRQADQRRDALKIEEVEPEGLKVEGLIDLDALAAAIAGAVAGGP